MLNLDPFTLDTIELLTTASDISKGQLGSVADFLDRHKNAIESALLAGLEDEKDGAQIALRLMKLRLEQLDTHSKIELRRVSVQRPIEESRFLLAIVGQLFHCIHEWMRTNTIDSITIDSLSEVQEYVLLELIAQNGYRQYFCEGDQV